MLIFKDTKLPWRGEAIQGVQYPLSIEKTWGEDRLLGLGLIVYLSPPAPEPDNTVVEVTASQAKIVLERKGLLPSVEALVNQHSNPEVRIWFNNALHWRKSNKWIQAFAEVLNLTPSQLDDLFIQASKVED